MAEVKTFVFHGIDRTGVFGEWDAILDGDGRISITQIVGDNIEFSGMSDLEDRNTKLWDLIEKVGFPDLSFPERSGENDEPQFVFDYKVGDIDVSKVVWANDVRSNEAIMVLIKEIQNIITIVSGKKPIF